MFKSFGREKPEIPDETPFHKLEKVGEGKYFEVKIPINDPDVVVKVARTKWKKGDEKGVHPLADPDSIRADLDMLKNNFEEYIPSSQLVVGKNERGEKTVYTIQDKIEGSDLDNLKYDENVAEQLKSFLNRVIDTYINNLVYYGSDSRPQSIFPDLKGENFIFGKDKKRNDKGDKLYFVDTYPIEETYVEDFINGYIPKIKKRFSREWRKIINEFRKESTEKIQNYLQTNRDKIKRIPVNN